MDNPNNQDSLADIQERTGIMEGSDESIQVEEITEKESESKAEEKPKAETEEVKAKSEPKDEDKDEDEESTVRTIRPTSDRPLKALFTQIKEVRADIAEIKKNATPAQKAEIKEVDDSLAALAEKRGLDAEGLAEIGEVLQSKILKHLEESGKLKNDLPKEIQDKLKLLDKLEAESKVKEEISHFNNEWTNLLPDIQKQFPNASQNELKEAKKIMDELAHSKDFHDKDLDYVLFKNQDKFSAILKVAKGKKAGETASKEIESSDDEEDIDLDPENMTPEKMKRYQNRKLSIKDDIQIMG